MKKLALAFLLLAASCVEGPSISTVSQHQESNCHVMKVPKGWRVHGVEAEGSIVVLTKAEPGDKPATYMVVGAYGHCYNVYEEQPSSP